MIETTNAANEIAVLIQNFLSSKIEGFLSFGLICIYTIPLSVRFAIIA